MTRKSWCKKHKQTNPKTSNLAVDCRLKTEHTETWNVSDKFHQVGTKNTGILKLLCCNQKTSQPRSLSEILHKLHGWCLQWFLPHCDDTLIDYSEMSDRTSDQDVLIPGKFHFVSWILGVFPVRKIFN